MSRRPKIVRSPDVMNNRWRLEGTRFPTDTLLGWDAGVDEMLEAFPHLTQTQVMAAIRFERSLLRRLGRLRRRIGLWMIGWEDD